MRFRSQGPSLVVDTPAKLNLFLDVRGKRPDGYHELETLMVSIGLFDTLRFSPADEGITLSIRDAGARCPDLSAGTDNLVRRAADLLIAESGCRRGVAIELEKRIPLESGLGGGSSDAAATLVGLDRFWNLRLSQPTLHALAARLGSDVNFFLDSYPLAMCRGRGEQIHPAPLGAPLHFVLARPFSGVSTAAAFEAWRRSTVSGDAAPVLASLSAGHMRALGSRLHNALQTPAVSLNPAISETLARLTRFPILGAAMTGSGSACFGLCSSRAQARRISGALRAWGALRSWAVTTGV
jgi:4-diphosphocytidyl-2-C-methyl-D-erythritol kinase